MEFPCYVRVIRDTVSLYGKKIKKGEVFYAKDGFNEDIVKCVKNDIEYLVKIKDLEKN